MFLPSTPHTPYLSSSTKSSRMLVPNITDGDIDGYIHLDLKSILVYSPSELLSIIPMDFFSSVFHMFLVVHETTSVCFEKFYLFVLKNEYYQRKNSVDIIKTASIIIASETDNDGIKQTNYL